MADDDMSAGSPIPADFDFPTLTASPNEQPAVECPACGSSRVKDDFLSLLQFVLLLPTPWVLISMVLRFWPDRYCLRCGTRFKTMAEPGHHQFELGVCYERGEGVLQNKTDAAKCYRKAAKKGHSAAQYNLGVLLLKGEGVAQDRDEAVKSFRRAAQQGIPEARVALAKLGA